MLVTEKLTVRKVPNERRGLRHTAQRLMRHLLALFLLLPLASCERPLPEVDAPAPSLRRLTDAQLRNAIADLFDEDIVVPAQLEPDVEIDGFFSIGASHVSLSPRGVEQYEEASYLIADQVLAPAWRDEFVPCEPAGTVDSDCAREFLADLAFRAWSRPVTADESERLADIADHAAQVLGDFHDGLAYGVAAVLQSPNFLYRDELGEDDGEGGRRFSDWDMASRLSFLFWNSIPDAELLRAAEAGELTTDEGILEQSERLLRWSRSREGVAAFVSELYTLHELDSLNKDPTLFTQMSDEVGPSARQETLLTFDKLVFGDDGDYRRIFTSRETFLNRKLAALYNVQAPSRDEFALTELDAGQARRGLLGQASILAQHSHPVNSSPTLRGKFIRTVLLCHTIPPPPSDVDTSIPEPSGDAPTLRDRVQEHLENPACASCHRITDPVGLGLENFDALGRHRTQDNGHDIDASGELDEVTFDTFEDLAQAVADHPDTPACFARQLFRYAGGHRNLPGERDALDYLAEDFELGNFSVQQLLLDLVKNPVFRVTDHIDLSEPAE